MSAIRSGTLKELADHGLAGKDVTCFFCGGRVVVGAQWTGHGGSLDLCRYCVVHGQLLGALIGDAVESWEDVDDAVSNTRKHAYRAALLASS